VLITGFSGFVGSSLARRLVDLGADVTGLVSDLNKNRDDQLWNRCNIVVGDICDYDVLRHAMAYYEVDAIFHFAAYAIVRVSARDPLSTYRVNVMGTANLLEATRHVGPVRSIVVASSDKAYGDHDLLPYTEKHALQPRNTYDTSKACMDMIARAYAANYDMPVVVTRCSNIYGPGDMNLSRIIPNTIKRVLEGAAPFLYSDVSKMEREFIFIDDVIDAYLLLGLDTDQLRGDAFNVGGTGTVKVVDAVKKICELMAKPELEPIVVHREAEFREIKKQYIDGSKLRLTLGWEPTTTLEDGLKSTIRWYSAFFAGLEHGGGNLPVEMKKRRLRF